MVAISFHPEFAGAVEAGVKRQTIRDKTQARAGSPLQLYVGQRTKACRKLMDAVCISVQPITLMERIAQPHGNVTLMGMYVEEFALKDGFASYAAMWSFFKDRADANGEYHGVIITW